MKRMNKLRGVCLFVFLGLSSMTFAENSGTSSGLIWSALRGLEYRVKAGFNFGGISPLPLPGEIREIKSFRP